MGLLQSRARGPPRKTSTRRSSTHSTRSYSSGQSRGSSKKMSKVHTLFAPPTKDTGSKKTGSSNSGGRRFNGIWRQFPRPHSRNVGWLDSDVHYGIDHDSFRLNIYFFYQYQLIVRTSVYRDERDGDEVLGSFTIVLLEARGRRIQERSRLNLRYDSYKKRLKEASLWWRTEGYKTKISLKFCEHDFGWEEVSTHEEVLAHKFLAYCLKQPKQAS